MIHEDMVAQAVCLFKAIAYLGYLAGEGSKVESDLQTNPPPPRSWQEAEELEYEAAARTKATDLGLKGILQLRSLENVEFPQAVLIRRKPPVKSYLLFHSLLPVQIWFV